MRESPGSRHRLRAGGSGHRCRGMKPTRTCPVLSAMMVPLVLVRRKKLSADERQRALIALQNLSVALDHEMSSLVFTKLSALAEEHRLSVYDAAYLELALRKKLPLGCKDGPLRAAAKRCHLKLL